MGKKSFRDWRDLNNNWGKAGERNMDRKVRGFVEKCEEAKHFASPEGC